MSGTVKPVVLMCGASSSSDELVERVNSAVILGDLSSLLQIPKMLTQQFKANYRQDLTQAIFEVCGWEYRELNLETPEKLFYNRDYGFHLYDPANGLNLLLVGKGHNSSVLTEKKQAAIAGATGEAPDIMPVDCYFDGGDMMYIPATVEHRAELIFGIKARSKKGSSTSTKEMFDRQVASFETVVRPLLVEKFAAFDIDISRLEVPYDLELYFYHLDLHLHFFEELRLLVALNLDILSESSRAEIQRFADAKGLTLIDLGYNVISYVVQDFFKQIKGLKVDSPLLSEPGRIVKTSLDRISSKADHINPHCLDSLGLKGEIKTLVQMQLSPEFALTKPFSEVFHVFDSVCAAYFMPTKPGLLGLIRPHAPTINLLSSPVAQTVFSGPMEPDLSQQLGEVLAAYSKSLITPDTFRFGKPTYNPELTTRAMAALKPIYRGVTAINILFSHLAQGFIMPDGSPVESQYGILGDLVKKQKGALFIYEPVGLFEPTTDKTAGLHCSTVGPYCSAALEAGVSAVGAGASALG